MQVCSKISWNFWVGKVMEKLPERGNSPRGKSERLTTSQVWMGLKPWLSWAFQFLEQKAEIFLGQFALSSQPERSL
jgi:hypothetical protein